MFNMEEFEKRIFQIEVRIFSKFDQKKSTDHLTLFAQDADTIGLSSEEREEVAKDGVDDVDEEVDDERMDEVFTGQGGGGDEVQRQLGLQQLAQLCWRPYLRRRKVLQTPSIGHTLVYHTYMAT